MSKQECIPVGCVPFAAVAVSEGGVFLGEGCLPGGGLADTPLPPTLVGRMTDTCKNITLLQLRLRTVNIIIGGSVVSQQLV